MEHHSVVSDVAETLARRIACGQYAPGDLMPSVRTVATEFEVNRATAALILGRLATMGFVDARRGKGFVVRDVRLTGGMDMYSRVFELSMGDPDVTIACFEDIIEVEQSILTSALLAFTESAPIDEVPRLEERIAGLETIARSEPADLTEFLEAETDLVRTLLTATGNTVHLAIFNSIARILLQVPEATRAVFAVSPDVHVIVWRALCSVWARGAEPSKSEFSLFDDLLAMYHRNVVAEFERQILGPQAADAATA